MPELPEAETIARALRTHLVGRRINRVVTRIAKLREPLRPVALSRACRGRQVLAVTRRGKGIIVQLEGDRALLVNLGMTGVCRVCPTRSPVAKHEVVLFHLDDGHSWRFEDPRRFGMIQAFRCDRPATTPAFLAMLGPEPLDKDFTTGYLFALTRRRTRTIKEVLLDQHQVAGIGNIYASELLFRAAIHPCRPAESLTQGECAAVVHATRAVLRAAIRAGGTTISDYLRPDGSEGRFKRQLRVYGRADTSCPRCGATIACFRQGGRSTYACPGCQR